VHHYNGTSSRETVLLIFPFLKTNITSQMWPSAGKGAKTGVTPITYVPEIDAEKRYQKTGGINRLENKALSYSLSKTGTRKIRYQTACQTLEKPVPVFGADFWYVSLEWELKTCRNFTMCKYESTRPASQACTHVH